MIKTIGQFTSNTHSALTHASTELLHGVAPSKLGLDSFIPNLPGPALTSDTVVAQGTNILTSNIDTMVGNTQILTTIFDDASSLLLLTGGLFLAYQAGSRLIDAIFPPPNPRISSPEQYRDSFYSATQAAQFSQAQSDALFKECKNPGNVIYGEPNTLILWDDYNRLKYFPKAIEMVQEMPLSTDEKIKLLRNAYIHRAIPHLDSMMRPPGGVICDHVRMLEQIKDTLNLKSSLPLETRKKLIQRMLDTTEPSFIGPDMFFQHDLKSLIVALSTTDYSEDEIFNILSLACEDSGIGGESRTTQKVKESLTEQISFQELMERLI